MICKGNLDFAKQELLQDKNNAVAYVFQDAEYNYKNKGKLTNCIFTIKDSYADKNVVARASSLLLDGFKPEYKATVIDLLEKAGATCIARTNLDEFGMGGTGEYSAFGIIKNPLNKDYLVGGSSSGAAATFTKNISFAIGSDTGDSVRKPASNIGKVGFKPSYGAISRYGLFAFASSLDTVAYFTHNVADSIELSSVLFEQDLKHDLTSLDMHFNSSDIKLSKPKKVAYLDCFDYLNEDVKSAYKNVLDLLQKDNVILEKISVNEKLLNSINVVYRIIAFSEANSNLANLNGVAFGNRIEGNSWEDSYIKTRSKGLGPMVQSRLILGAFFLEEQNQYKYFDKAKRMRRYLSNYFTEIHRNSDCFIYPASNDAAPKLKENQNSSFMDFILTNSNLTGNPSLTLKMGQKKSNNLPFNLAIDSEIYSDKKLLSYALYFEKKLGGENGI
ncbi:amidase family protein [Metamycoplasma buccale]|uniref:amidase family protein n=1 Tax=Metamycoplasma buccale TaxID=55602 RepID=UPI00398F2D68